MLLIGEVDSVDFYREVTRKLGAQDYLSKPLTSDKVARRFGEIVAGRAPVADSVQGGGLVVITGVKGGVGATTLAVNLGGHFGVSMSRHTVILDPDLHLGDMSFLLNIKPGPGLRMALAAPERIDALLAERAAQPVAGRLHMLAGDEPLATRAELHPGRGRQPGRCTAAAVQPHHRRRSVRGASVRRSSGTAAPTRVGDGADAGVGARDLAPPVGAKPSGAGEAAGHRAEPAGIAGRPDPPASGRRSRREGGCRRSGSATSDRGSRHDGGTGDDQPGRIPQWHSGTGGPRRLRGAIGYHSVRGAAHRERQRCARLESVQAQIMSYVQSIPRFGRREPALGEAVVSPRGSSGPTLPAKVPDQQIPAAPKAPSNAITELRRLCLTRLEPAAITGMPSDQLTDDIEILISEIATEHRVHLNAVEQRELAEELVYDITGLGPLEPLLADDSINDIMVNGPRKIFVESRGKVFLSNAHFRDTAHLINVCQRIAAGIGRRIDESSPMVDARLKDGSRVNIVFPPLALDGPYVSIRKFGKKVMDFAQLVGFGALTPQVARILQLAVPRAAQHHHFRWHRVGQDHADERPVAADRCRGNAW